MNHEKPIYWLGSSYQDLLDFPKEIIKEAGYQLSRVQAGLEPDHWKAFSEVGVGVREIRLQEKSGAYRIMYIAYFNTAVYVLHCFQKKNRATSQKDKTIAITRYRAITSRDKT